MTNNWRIVTVAIVLLLMPLAASAFGPNGHRIVAHIATLHMDSNARREIVRLLGDQSLESVSTWPDDMRDSPDQDYWKKAAAWHFVSVPDGENYLTATKTPNGDAYTQLLYFLSQLRSQMTSQEDRAIALKWVAHIVGDLHQPLHCGHTADAGGNDINVSWFDQTKNLHEVWDIGLIEYDNLSFSEYADFINVTDES
ncbi:MAG: S1/P1 Nuclease, partial [Epsilonproteobacteria bacterium]